MLTPEEQEVLDQYVEQMSKRVWKQRDPKLREEAYTEISESDVASELRKIYARVLEQIKTFCPDLNEELGYHPWSQELTDRVQNWINIVLSGNVPEEISTPAAISNVPTGDTPAEATKQDELPGPSTSEPATSTVDDDLPF